MMPLDLFARRTFAVTNAVSFFMYFGTFGAIFLLTQYTQLVMGFEPFDAGVRMLVWTGATAVTAPLAGILAERYGPRAFMAGGLALLAGALAWIAAGAGATTEFAALVIPFAMAGVGMALVFAPSASALLSVVSPERAGQASGTNNAIREVGGVFGVAVLSSVFAHSGGFGSAQAFVDGFGPAVWLGAGVVAAGAVSALLLPARRPAPVGAAGAEPAPVAA
jgi:predicted MFS family arabinose efflux permease